MAKNRSSFLKIIADNKPGTIAAISRLLAKKKINIEDMSAVGFGEKGLIVLLTSDAAKAVDVLQENGYSVLADKGLVIKMEDRPGSMAKVTSRLAKGKVNINSVSALGKDKKFIYFMLTADPLEKAKQLLKEYLV